MFTVADWQYGNTELLSYIRQPARVCWTRRKMQPEPCLECAEMFKYIVLGITVDGGVCILFVDDANLRGGYQ